MPNIEMESPVKKPTHPKVSVMVETAIKTLAEPKGSSLRAINKYISANYDVDVQKLSIFIKKFLKSAVETGDMIQTSGNGATGSFKIVDEAKANPKAPVVKSEKPLKMQTSTSQKTSKVKKASAKSPNKSPVKELKLTDDEEVPADTTFIIIPKKAKKPRVSVPTKARKSRVSAPTKIKKPKKLAKKVKEPKAAMSSTGESENAVTSPKLVKSKAKTTQTKKSPKTKKPAASNLKEAVSKKPSTED